MTIKKRKNLKPEERRAQLIGVAQFLFFSKGFEETTMTDLLAAAEISKGGFYHHFKSKDELLFGVLDQMAEGVLSNMENIATNSASPALELLHQFLHLRSDYLKEHDYPGQVEFFSVMNDVKNTALLEGFKRRVKVLATPLLTEIIQKGLDEGVFETAHAKTAAELILFLGSFMDGALKVAIDARATSRADLAAFELQAAVDMQYLTIDRILGLPDGTTNFGWPEAVEVTMATTPIHG